MAPDTAPNRDQDRITDSAAEQVVLRALEELAAERNFPGGDLDLVTPEVAARLAVAALRQAGLLNGDPALRAALEFYADPVSYFAIAILPDRPSGAFADDFGCVIGPHGNHDHRHGRVARRALGDEWWGTEPCEGMRKLAES